MGCALMSKTIIGDIMSNNTECQILSLSGGGYKGLYTATVLASFEQELKKPVAHYFDLLAGTSIGGIIALAASFEIPMQDVVNKFKERGDELFKKSTLNWGLCGPKYSSKILREIITDLIGEKTTLGQAKHPVIIPSINMTSGKIRMFKTPHYKDFIHDKNLKVVDIALATSAAPTYFDLAEVNGSRYADGGLFANAPDLAAIHEITHYWGVDEKTINLLSIGALSSSYSLSPDIKNNMGIKDWIWISNTRLIETMMSAQQQLTHQLLNHKIGENRYHRIDVELGREQSNLIALDNATVEATKTLTGLGLESAKEHYVLLNKKNFWAHKGLKLSER